MKRIRVINNKNMVEEISVAIRIYEAFSFGL